MRDEGEFWYIVDHISECVDRDCKDVIDQLNAITNKPNLSKKKDREADEVRGDHLDDFPIK